MNLEQLLSPSPGGVGRYAAKLALHLGQLGVEVHATVARHSQAAVVGAWVANGLEGVVARPWVAPLPRPVLYDSWHLAGWPPLAGAGRCDLSHAPSLAVPPSSGHPLVVSIHDAGPWLWPETFGRRGRSFHSQGARAAARRADVVLTGSQAAADEVATYIGIPPERIRVVPYGVDPSPDLDPSTVTEARSRLGLGGHPYALWVGSLEPRKGVDILVAAMADLYRRRRDLEPSAPEAPLLVLAGYAGWQNRSLLGPADVEVLGPALVQLGPVSEPDLQALYKGASVFAFPSVHEGFGLPVLEAMAAGAPVVASDIGPLREVSGGYATLVAPGDPMAWSDALNAALEAGGAEGRARLVAAARERAALYSWRATAKATLEIYKSLL